jgi:hypothetical protein
MQNETPLKTVAIDSRGVHARLDSTGSPRSHLHCSDELSGAVKSGKIIRRTADDLFQVNLTAEQPGSRLDWVPRGVARNIGDEEKTRARRAGSISTTGGRVNASRGSDEEFLVRWNGELKKVPAAPVGDQFDSPGLLSWRASTNLLDNAIQPILVFTTQAEKLDAELRPSRPTDRCQIHEDRWLF